VNKQHIFTSDRIGVTCWIMDDYTLLVFQTHWHKANGIS